MQQPVHYRVTPADPHAHLFEVELTVAAPDPAGQHLSLPAWIPGSYMIRDFAKHVIQLAAVGDGRPLAVTKLDKQTWRCAPCPGPLTVRYRVYCWDLSVRGAHLDASHGYFNGTALFLRVHGQEHGPHTLELEPPAADSGWRVATTLTRADAPHRGFGRYRAADYDELIDHPVEMGTFTLVEFEACGVPHAVAITGRHRGDTARLARDLQRLCEYQIRLFGEPAPMAEYLFLVTVVGDGYGGLEHRSSTSLLCSRDDLPRPGEDKVGNGYRSFLGLCSHEYFHTWNVKRIRPAAFIPYDLEREVHTTLLWAFEGFTAYYDDLILVRCGLIEPPSYLELLGQTITRVLRGPGRLKQSVAESSFDAWTKFYQQNEGSPNHLVSYYAKGSLVALALDLSLRRASGDARSLDDLMRALWRRCLETGAGVAEDEIERLAEAIAGQPLGELFDQAVRGTADLPLAELLEPLGVRLHLRPATGDGDKGGKPAGDSGGPPVWLGLRLAEEGEPKVALVLEGGPAERAGLSASDVLVAVDGLRVTRANLDKRLAGCRPGEPLRLHAFRRDELLELTLIPAAPPADTAYLTLDDAATPEVHERRQGWLGWLGA